MTALTRTAMLAAVAALMTLGGCSKKEPAAPAESAATSAPAPAPAEPAPAPAEPAATPSPAPPPPTASTEAPTTVPPAAEAATPPAAAEAPPEPAAAPATTAPATPEASSAAAPAAATETVAANAPAKPIDGGTIAQGICVACHGSGMNGAPKLGNKIAWTPRIAQGRETVYTHALKGLRGMPPRGGNPALSDDEVKAAVDYMVKLAGGWKD